MGSRLVPQGLRRGFWAKGFMGQGYKVERGPGFSGSPKWVWAEGLMGRRLRFARPKGLGYIVFGLNNLVEFIWVGPSNLAQGFGPGNNWVSRCGRFDPI